MRIKPIPITLLPHSCEYSPINLGDWENETEGDSVAISYIRIEPCSKRVISKDNKEKQLSALLFHDMINSKPFDHKYKHGDIVRFNGITYHIESVEALYDNNRLHHYEVGLI